MKLPDFEAQVPALLRHAAQSNPARTHDHLPTLRRQMAEAPQRAQPRIASHPAWRRTGAIAGACALVAVAALLFTHLPRHQSLRTTTISGAMLPQVTAQQAWGGIGSTSFPFDTQQGNLQPVAITPDGRTLIILNYAAVCPNPCPPGTDVTGIGIDTYDIATHALHSLYLEHGVPGGVATDGRYIGFWQGIPGTGPNYKGQEVKVFDLTTDTTRTIASVTFAHPGDEIGTLSSPQVDHGLMVWGEVDSPDGEEQDLYLANLATGATQLIAPHITRQYLHWPYLVYMDGTSRLFVRDLTTGTTRQIPTALDKDPNAIFIYYSLNSTTLAANTTEQTATGYQLVILGLDLTQPNATWQPIVTVPSSRYPTQVMMNDRLIVWSDTTLLAWDRVQQRLVTLVPPDTHSGVIMQGKWILIFTQPEINSTIGTVTIIDTSVLPKQAP